MAARRTSSAFSIAKKKKKLQSQRFLESEREREKGGYGGEEEQEEEEEEEEERQGNGHVTKHVSYVKEVVHGAPYNTKRGAVWLLSWPIDFRGVQILFIPSSPSPYTCWTFSRSTRLRWRFQVSHPSCG